MGLFNFRPSVRPVPLEVHIQGFPGQHYCPRMASINKPTFHGKLQVLTMKCIHAKSWVLFLLELSRVISFFKKMYWSIVDLQCCVSFRYTAKCFSDTCIYIYSVIHAYVYIQLYMHMYICVCVCIYSFSDIFHYRLSQNIEYSSLC